MWPWKAHLCNSCSPCWSESRNNCEPLRVITYGFQTFADCYLLKITTTDFITPAPVYAYTDLSHSNIYALRARTMAGKMRATNNESYAYRTITQQARSMHLLPPPFPCVQDKHWMWIQTGSNDGEARLSSPRRLGSTCVFAAKFYFYESIR